MHTRAQPGDVILVHMEEKPAFFGRLEELLLDRKPGWLQVRFTVLGVPLQELTWTLEPCQLDGEPFTMGGTPVRIETLPPVPRPAPEPDPEPAKRPAGGTVVSFPPRKGS